LKIILPKRFPTHGRRFDPAAALLPRGFGLAGYRRGLAGAPSAAAQAIATAEGYGKLGAIPTVANNPGDLEIGDIGYGVSIAAGGQKITNFGSADQGWSALQNQIYKITTGTSSAGYLPGMSIAEVGQLYSGGSTAWANNVASSLGVTPDTPFSAVAGGGGSTGVDTSLLADDSSSSSDVLAASVVSLGGDNTGLIIAGTAIALAAGIYAFSS
jgi:hypothetical protein